MAKSKKDKHIERADIFNGHNQLNLDDPEGAKLYPVLFDCLRPRWRDGVQTRQRGKLSIVPLGSVYKVTVDCPTEVLETSVLLTTLVDLLAHLELFLASGKGAWTPGYQKNRRALPTVDAAVQ